MGLLTIRMSPGIWYGRRRQVDVIRKTNSVEGHRQEEAFSFCLLCSPAEAGALIRSRSNQGTGMKLVHNERNVMRLPASCRIANLRARAAAAQTEQNKLTAVDKQTIPVRWESPTDSNESPSMPEKMFASLAFGLAGLLVSLVVFMFFFMGMNTICQALGFSWRTSGGLSLLLLAGLLLLLFREVRERRPAGPILKANERLIEARQLNEHEVVFVIERTVSVKKKK